MNCDFVQMRAVEYNNGESGEKNDRHCVECINKIYLFIINNSGIRYTSEQNKLGMTKTVMTGEKTSKLVVA